MSRFMQMNRFSWLALSQLVACQPTPSKGLGSDLPTCGLSQIAVKTDDGYRCTSLDTEFNTLARADLQCNDGEVVIYDAGRWTCGAPSSVQGGDITSVRTAAGSGLVGGSDSGVVSLGVSFAGSGSATTVSRSDHSHTFAELTGIPGGIADGVDNDLLASLVCSNGQVPLFDGPSGLWLCGTPAGGSGPLVETDPTVNALAKASLSGCSNGQELHLVSGTWTCVSPALDSDLLSLLLPLCNDGEVVVRRPMGFACELPAVGSGDITAIVTATGSGLTGGVSTGSATLAVDFAGGCGSGQVACSTHTHPVPTLSAVLGTSTDAANQRITNVAPPVAGTDVVTKNYVDALSGGTAASDAAVAICCGSGCDSSYPGAGWLCDDVGLLRDSSGATVTTGVAADKITMFLPEKRGFIVVPNTGAPTLYAPSGVATTLSTCASEWRVCTKAGVSAAFFSCGLFGSTPSTPLLWSCASPPLSYLFLPKSAGVLRTAADGVTGEYLSDAAAPFATPATFDCTGATAPPQAPSVTRFVCTR